MVDASGDRIVMLGGVFHAPYYAFAAAMYDKGGALVPSFNGGTVVLPVGDNESNATSGGLTDDGSVTMVGDASSGGTNVFAAARLTKSGAPDTSFGTNGHGWVTTSIGSLSAAFAGGFGPDHRVVAVGFSDSNFALARYLNK